ncbi:hypothetical protein [Phormidium pseudopriestleyi]|nr:hypothetical protein [Phormidium pseudopriestleyi]
MATGLSKEQVAEVTGDCQNWIPEVARRYNNESRQHQTGRSPL